MKDKGKSAYRLTGKLKAYFRWIVIAGILAIIMDIEMFSFSVPSGLVAMVFVVLYWIIVLFILAYIRPGIMHDLVDFSANYSQVQHQLLLELSIPYALLDSTGRILWMNQAMQTLTGKKKDFRNNIATVFGEVTPNNFPEMGQTRELRTKFGKRDYCVELKTIPAHVLTKNSKIYEEDESATLVAMYMFDETDINMYIQKLKDERFVVALIDIDNYDDALANVEDVRKSLFIGLIDKRVNRYFSAGQAVVRKLEKDKYMAVFRYKYLERLQADKFSILEEIKEVNIGNEMSITLSIGIGTGASDYARNFTFARQAIDLALGRGGDQCVVKDNDKITYYGGKSQQMEKNTRVKVRVKAQALRQILESNDNVIIMGHKLPDIDAFGSAVGQYVIAKSLGKNANIVLNEVPATIRPFVNRFYGRDDYPADAFVSSEQALALVNPKTVVIVTDVNTPERTECPELLKKCRTVVVFDHHRRSSDSINGAVLSYVDPNASSASEMVTEMIQYVSEDIKLKGFEADTLYGGMVIDTDGYNSKSGPRTFEAAAFLRRHGADVTRVRKLLRTDMNEYREIAQTVSRSEIYREFFAISVFNGDGIDNPTVGGAKAANQLLDISGIKAAFVITAYDGKMFISARSIDEVNVQLIMEKLGGGGHIAAAGAQLSGVTVEQAIEKIKDVLDAMLKEGEIQ